MGELIFKINSLAEFHDLERQAETQLVGNDKESKVAKEK